MGKGKARTSWLRLSPIAVMIAAVFAVLLVVLTGMAFGGAGSARGAAPGSGLSTAVTPATLATTLIDLNRSQSAGTYVSEYVTLNNTTTLTKLPIAITVVATTCRWVIVQNLTAPAVPSSVFHNVQFHNVTTLNDTGNSADKATGFKICGGAQVWVNYVYWTYSIYQFSASTLGIAANMTLGGFSDWIGTTIAPANVSAPIGASHVAQFIVSSNLTFTAVLPGTVDSGTTCDATHQICSFTQYSFVSATDSVNTTSSTKIAFTKASGLLVTAAYENWTVGYTSATVSANTQIGGFFADTNSFFQAVFVQFWYLWILALLVIALVGAVASKRRQRR